MSQFQKRSCDSDVFDPGNDPITFPGSYPVRNTTVQLTFLGETRPRSIRVGVSRNAAKYASPIIAGTFNQQGDARQSFTHGGELNQKLSWRARRRFQISKMPYR